MADNIQITVTAKDEAGKILATINADIALTGKAAAKAAQQVEQASSKWGRFTQYVQKNKAELKTAGRAFIRLTSDVSRAGDDTEQALFGIRAAYKDTAQDWVAWSKEMQQATTFSDEAFMRSAQNMKTLVTNYALSEDQVRELITASADLAAVNRIDVYEAVTRVQSAVRGEAEASEFLGLTLNDTYMKNIAFSGSLKDTWEKLDDATKAQYRYQEILNQSAYAQGKATEATKTAEGQYQQTKNAVQDFVAEIGQGINKSGPWLKMLEDGLGLVDNLAPLYTALTLARLKDIGATEAHTTAQVADNAAMTGGVSVVGKLTGSLAGAGGAGGLAAALGVVSVALAEVVAAGWIYANLAQEQHRINQMVTGSAEWYEHQIRELNLALEQGAIDEGYYALRAKQLRQEMDAASSDLKTARQNAADLTTELDNMTTAAQGAGTALRGLQLPKESTAYQPPGYKEGPTDVDVRKEAYQELLKLPQRRAEAEKTGDAIITEAAKVSTDQRVQAAIGAINRENTAHAAAVAKLKSDRETYNAWVVSEQERIAGLRAEGSWQEAGLEEQKLLHIQEWHRQNDKTVEDLEREHVARMAGYQTEYQAALQNTSDYNLRLQMDRKTTALNALKEEEAMLKQVMATGKRTSTEWTGSWKTAMKHFKERGKEEFDKFYDHIRNKLDKPISLTIHGVYIPPPGMTEGTHGKGRGDIAQYGGIWSRPTRVLLGEAGPEAVIPLTKPQRARALMAMAGLDRLVTRSVPTLVSGPRGGSLAAAGRPVAGGGGVTVSAPVHFSGPVYARSEADLEAIGAVIADHVARKIGQGANVLTRAGIRSGGY